MYSTILVGTDGSATADKAVHAAATLARQLGATLHVVVGYRTGGPGMGAAAGAPMVDTGMGGALRQEAAKEIGDSAAEHWAEGLDPTVHQVGGDPADAILDTADKVGADLVVVGSKGMHGARRVLGSVPNSVSHGAKCAVLIVKTD